jgi:hypothetical protein
LHRSSSYWDILVRGGGAEGGGGEHLAAAAKFLNRGILCVA